MTSTKMYLDDAVFDEDYTQRRGRSCSVHRAGRWSSNELAPRPRNLSPNDDRAVSGHLVIRNKSRSRSTVRLSDQKFLVRARSPNMHLRPPVDDRTRSTSRDQCRSRTRSRRRSRDESWSRSRSRSRSRRRSSSSCDDLGRPTRPGRPDRSPSGSRNGCSPGPRSVKKISRKTVTRYAVDPALSRGSNQTHHRSRSQHQQVSCNSESDRRMVRVEASRTNVVRVRASDICPESLDHFRYPWEWSSVCTITWRWVFLKADAQ